jgi:hypothetical protein
VGLSICSFSFFLWFCFLSFFWFEYLYKKSLRGIVVFMLYQERQKAVLMNRRSADPVMGQELYMLGCGLHVPDKGSVSKMRRLSWMDGSDSDDEDQHSRSSIHKEAESQPRSVYTIFIC